MSQCHKGGGSVTTCDKCDKGDEGDENTTTNGQADEQTNRQAEPSAVLFDIAPKQSTAAWDDDCPF